MSGEIFAHKGELPQILARLVLAVTPLVLLPLLPVRIAVPEVSAFELARLGLLGLAAASFGVAIADRQGAAPARAYLIAGVSGGALTLMGPFGAAFIAITLAFLIAFPDRRGLSPAKRRADLLILGFVPACVLAGLVFVAWSRTGGTPKSLLFGVLGSGRERLSENPWLTHFGGGAAISCLVLVGVAMLCCPWLADRRPNRSARAAMMLVAAGVASAAVLSAANLWDDPAGLLAVCAAASVVALRRRARLGSLVLSVCGFVFASALLSGFVPHAPSRALAWSIGRSFDQPPAWGVDPSARRDFLLKTGQDPDAFRD